MPKALNIYRSVVPLVFACAAGAAAYYFSIHQFEEARKPQNVAAQHNVAPKPNVAPAKIIPAPTGWGHIKGRIVWSGKEIPPREKLKITQDEEMALRNGPLYSEDLVVDPNTRGIRDVYVFFRFTEAPPIHPSLPQSTESVTEMDEAAFKKLNGFKMEDMQKAIAERKIEAHKVQSNRALNILCATYVPHALAVREGERVLIVNQDLNFAHHAKISSNNPSDDHGSPPSLQAPLIRKFTASSLPIRIECSIHGWMEASMMIFDHPYFAVTVTDGTFEIKNIPAGARSIVFLHPKLGYIDPHVAALKSKGRPITIAPDKTLGLGDIKVEK